LTTGQITESPNRRLAAWPKWRLAELANWRTGELAPRRRIALSGGTPAAMHAL
jgi:hypothetical protein